MGRKKAIEKVIRVCEVCQITSETTRVSYRSQFNKILCSKHNRQLKLTGEIQKRNIFDKNKIIKYNDYAEIILYNRNNQEINRTIIEQL